MRPVLKKALCGIGLAITAVIAAMIAVVVLWPQLLPADVPNPWARLSIQSRGGGVYWVSGGVSNTGFIVGDKGVVVIDAQMFKVTAENVLAQIARITPEPVNAIILTHSDPDHVNGLPTYPHGIEVIAHENTRTDMVAALADRNIRWISRPSATMKDFLPTRLVRDKDDIVLDGVHIVLLHFAPAHTDGDLIVFLPEHKVVFAGDLLAVNVGPYPGIHRNKHGTSLGWIKSVHEMLALDADLFISGHGEPQTRPQVAMRLQAAERRRTDIEALVAQGKTLDEIKAALKDPKPTGVAALFPTFTETTYEELVGKK